MSRPAVSRNAIGSIDRAFRGHLQDNAQAVESLTVIGHYIVTFVPGRVFAGGERPDAAMATQVPTKTPNDALCQRPVYRLL